MRAISIKTLHAATGKWVRSSAKVPLLITDRGQPVAVLHAPGAFAAARPGFPARTISELPWVGGDSTAGISQDREDR
jgi:hypothetical protein